MTTITDTFVSQNYDVESVREDFPILRTLIHGKPLVYLDNANTTQKPQIVLDTLQKFYTESNANIHRATHLLSERATAAYDGARRKVQRFLNAELEEEIIFVRNATEGINLVAQTFGRKFIKQGDEILVSAMEHHANIVPWQMLCEEKGCKLRAMPIDDNGDLILDDIDSMLNERTKLVGIVQMSNALGTINPVGTIIAKAHEKGIPVLVDGAQSAYHIPIDVQAMDCDFFVFSGHKLYGPTGIGALYGKRKLLEQMPPWMGGGDMILSVTFEKTIYNDLPFRFEAGTPHIAGAVGLGAAIDYLESLGMKNIEAHENELTVYTDMALAQVPGIRMIGTPRHRAGVFSFILGNVHPHDIGAFLDNDGIAIRTGQHCAHPIMQRFGVPATARISIGCYNTRAEIDTLVESLRHVQKVFS